MTDAATNDPMWLNRLTSSGMLVALPVGHLLVASLYTWAWLAGFGANVSVLADPRDLFSVSMSKLVNVYAIGLVLPVAQFLFMRRRFQRGGGGTGPTPRSLRWIEIALDTCLWAGFTLTVILSIDLQQRGSNPGFQMMLAANIAGIIAYKFILDHVEFRDDSFRYLNIGTGLLAAAIGFGLSDGSAARYTSHEYQSPRLPHCGNYLVLRRFGEAYVAIAPLNGKVVTNLECEVLMRIPAVNGKARRSFHWLPFPHVQYVPFRADAPRAR